MVLIQALLMHELKEQGLKERQINMGCTIADASAVLPKVLFLLLLLMKQIQMLCNPYQRTYAKSSADQCHGHSKSIIPERD